MSDSLKHSGKQTYFTTKNCSLSSLYSKYYTLQYCPSMQLQYKKNVTSSYGSLDISRLIHSRIDIAFIEKTERTQSAYPAVSCFHAVRTRSLCKLFLLSDKIIKTIIKVEYFFSLKTNFDKFFNCVRVQARASYVQIEFPTEGLFFPYSIMIQKCQNKEEAALDRICLQTG